MPRASRKGPSVVQLKAMCKKKGVKGYSKMNKSQLLRRCQDKKSIKRQGSPAIQMSDLPKELENIIYDYKKDLENKLYVIEPTIAGHRKMPMYDVARKFVVSAMNVKNARKVAASNHNDEGPEIWLKAKWSSVKMISPMTNIKRERVVVKSTRDG